MTETSNGVLDTQKEAQEQTQNENKAMSYERGIIKVNLNELNKPTENAIQSKKQMQAMYYRTTQRQCR
jgi:hypothetical protein